MLGHGGCSSPRGCLGRPRARAWGRADPLAIPTEGYCTGIPFLWEPCACRYGLRYLSSRPGDACGSGQGTARQVFPHAVQGIPAATLLLCSPPHPLCLVVVGCWSDTGPPSVYTSISAVPSGPAPPPGPAGQVFRCFHTAPAGAFPSPRQRGGSVASTVPGLVPKLQRLPWPVQGVRSRFLLLSFPQKLLNV